MSNDKKLRRMQLISPWGVGSIVPFPFDESLIIASIDKWDLGSSEEVVDERFAKRLKVNTFKTPPVFNPASSFSTHNGPDKNQFVRAYRFPQWLYCPKCGKMKWIELTKDGKVSCNHEGTKEEGQPERRMIPERFIVICPEGHIMNFPVFEYVHGGITSSDIDFNSHVIIRKSGENSATLSGISYECLTCKTEPKHLGGITKKGALSKLYFCGTTTCSCPGYSPWFGNKYEECGVENKDLLVVQRGGSNVWYPETKSSISIPTTIGTNIEGAYLDAINKILSIPSVSDTSFMESLFQAYANAYKIDVNKLKQAYSEVTKDNISSEADLFDEDSYRKKEYDVLKKDSGNDSSSLFCRNFSIDGYDESIRPFFKSVSLVYKMTETRAFIGFSRMRPKSNSSIDEFKAKISSEATSWLPAVQVVGEGIFIEFDPDYIQKWKAKEGVSNRAQIMNEAYNNSFFGKNNNDLFLNPEYVLIHTFSHLLINELSKKCGYGSSALRERLYVNRNTESNMFGVLIYTASGDSEGSLGGLVREGKPGRLEGTIHSCIKEALWCTADPMCIESNGQGPDSCNLAACYNCTLLPETCCENGNRLLDRGMLIGTTNCTGYFADLFED